jgi:hypothetical protein
MTPKVLSEDCTPTMKSGLQSFHSAVRTSRSPSLAPRINSMTIYAVASLSTSGVLVTLMPRALAVASSQ